MNIPDSLIQQSDNSAAYIYKNDNFFGSKEENAFLKQMQLTDSETKSPLVKNETGSNGYLQHLGKVVTQSNKPITAMNS